MAMKTWHLRGKVITNEFMLGATIRKHIALDHAIAHSLIQSLFKPINLHCSQLELLYQTAQLYSSTDFAQNLEQKQSHKQAVK